LTGVLANGAGAETLSAPVVTPHVRAQLVALDRAIDGRLSLGLRLTLKPGWHTYWRNPGDSGEPPTLRLSMPDGANAAFVGWPAPERIDIGGIVSYGHHGDALFIARTILPVEATQVEAEATWLVCEKVCVPETGRFKLDLASTDTADAGTLAALDRLKPVLPPSVDGTVTRDGDRLRLIVSVAKLGGTPVASYFFPYQTDVVDHSARQGFRVGEGTLAMDLTPFDPRTKAPLELSGLLEIEIATDGGRKTLRYELLARLDGKS
jgi:thiol:disulfide interchange protein DsbD